MKTIVHFEGHPDSFEKTVHTDVLPAVGDPIRVAPETPRNAEPLPGYVTRREFDEETLVLPQQYQQIGQPRLVTLVAHLYVQQA